MRPRLARLSVVTHIGTLNPDHKGERGPSQEGMGVSFSHHPEDWERIAKLGGQDWWTADLSGLRILEGHSFVKKYQQALFEWGVEQKLVEPVPTWQVSWYDEELDDTVSFLAASLQQAQDEVEYMEEYEIKEVPGYAPTPDLIEAMGASPSDLGKPSLSADQDLATIWARREGLDGVWWADAHDPTALSAPRGVIFPERVSGVVFKRVERMSPSPARRVKSP